MNSIQIDMFEVQLGAGQLLQFRTRENRVVRILADAGVGSAKGYKPDHVHKKLNDALNAFGDSSRHIDLIIASHYDADHLTGLVPIIEDTSIRINEAWLPPVANDNEPPLSSGPPGTGDFLAQQLGGELGEVRLNEYLDSKLKTCDVIRDIERLAEDPGQLPGVDADNIGRTILGVVDRRSQFERHRAEAVRRLRNGTAGHADDEIFVLDSPRRTVPRIADAITLVFAILLLLLPWIFHSSFTNRASLNAWICGILTAGLVFFKRFRPSAWQEFTILCLGFWLTSSTSYFGLVKIPGLVQLVVGSVLVAHAVFELWFRQKPQPSVDLSLENATFIFRERWTSNASLIASDLRSLAFIREGAAKDGINISSLAEVVRALRARNIPTTCQTIRDGVPRRFVWSSTEGRIVPGARLSTSGPELILLGPSVGLVRKHWDRLPVGQYMALATFDRLPVATISPSNALSYVIRIGFAEQGLLITGDAGCVDFKYGRGNRFHKKLLNALLPLHVVQVAHHAGRNAEFYNVLGEVGYGAQRDHSWLLLSHATRDPKRPSQIFASFIGQVRKNNQISLLFTSEPENNKVSDYISLIYPPIGKPGPVGDVRLSFTEGAWRVDKHSVSVRSSLTPRGF